MNILVKWAYFGPGDQTTAMTASRRPSEPPPPSNVRWPDAAEAIKFIDELLETSDRSDDISDWEELKRLLDEDRLSDRKLFPND